MSDLFNSSKVGLPDFRAFLAISLSSWLGYLVESMAIRIKSAELTASSIWSWMCDSNSSLGSLSPAVSIKMYFPSTLPTTLSRVVPASRATMACDLRTRRLKRLDLPALVWPMIATTGNFIPYILAKLTNARKYSIIIARCYFDSFAPKGDFKNENKRDCGIS